jgi:hypothetical protein
MHGESSLVKFFEEKACIRDLNPYNPLSPRARVLSNEVEKKLKKVLDFGKIISRIKLSRPRFRG